jgi:hypothetical protein
VPWRTIVRRLTGVALALLGLLWALQGADVVRVDPILCTTDCTPVTGGSPTWLAVGLVTLVGGLALAAVRPRRGQ